MWGVRDHYDKSTYGANILGERDAIPAMLDAFAKYGIRATWASVGMAFAESKDELLASCPSNRPTYENPRLSNYAYIDEVGENEKKDPYYFGASLIRQIAQQDGQEIGSHTFSHYYCLEPGQTPEQFCDDMDAAVAIASRYGIQLRSFVFPRNQYSAQHLAALADQGINVFRGNESSWIYRATPGAGQSKLQRGFRLADHYINITGANGQTPRRDGALIDLPASRFLRPYSRKLAFADNLRLGRILSAMTRAAQTGEVFHLWWHPHNFGVNTGENIAFLTRILEHFRELKDRFGMTSQNMGDFYADHDCN